jgi:hypothetical protein
VSNLTTSALSDPTIVASSILSSPFDSAVVVVVVVVVVLILLSNVCQSNPQACQARQSREHELEHESGVEQPSND